MKTLKRVPASEREAMKAAQTAANLTHDAVLRRSGATATPYVCDEVIEAARRAYCRAGGRRDIVVIGRGNATHPVATVECRIASQRA